MGWSGYRCEIAAAPVDSSASSGSKSDNSDHLDLKTKNSLLLLLFLMVVISLAGTTSVVVPVLLLLLLAMLAVGAILWYKRRMRG